MFLGIRKSLRVCQDLVLSYAYISQPIGYSHVQTDNWNYERENLGMGFLLGLYNTHGCQLLLFTASRT